MSVASSRTLVIQASPGIGDMIWHLPYLRAIARREGPLTILTKSRSLAKEWLTIDPLIEDVLYADRRLLSTIVPEIRRRRFRKSWILHRSFSYGLLPWLARIPERGGFGYGKQRWLLTTPRVLAPNLKSCHTILQLQGMMDLMGLVPDLIQDQVPPLCSLANAFIQDRFQSYVRPWIGFGLGGSEPSRKWPYAYFIELAKKFLQEQRGTLFLCGSATEATDIQEVYRSLKLFSPHIEQAVVPVTDLTISQAFALMNSIDLYVGNDTSLLNIAASFKTPALGLFGGSTPLTYSSYIHSITPEDSGLNLQQGMTDISPQAVWDKMTLLKAQWGEMRHEKS